MMEANMADTLPTTRIATPGPDSRSVLGHYTEYVDGPSWDPRPRPVDSTLRIPGGSTVTVLEWLVSSAGHSQAFARVGFGGRSDLVVSSHYLR